MFAANSDRFHGPLTHVRRMNANFGCDSRLGPKKTDDAISGQAICWNAALAPREPNLRTGFHPVGRARASNSKPALRHRRG
jgi:hypothetical protein